MLGDPRFGIIPYTNCVIFEAWGKTVLGGQLEHFSLALSNALNSIVLWLVDLLNNVFKSTLNLIIKPNQLVISDLGILLSPVIIGNVGFDVLLKPDFLTFKFIDKSVFRCLSSWLGGGDNTADRRYAWFRGV
jgi:hypothetical protein